MAANQNLVPRVGASTNDGAQETGTKIRTLQGEDASGNVYRFVEGGVGVGTMTNGADTTSTVGGQLAFDMATRSMTMTRYTVTTSAALALATPVAYRKAILLYNEGPNTVYYSTNASITASAGANKGITLRPYERHMVRWGVRFALYAIRASSSSATVLYIVELV